MVTSQFSKKGKRSLIIIPIFLVFFIPVIYLMVSDLFFEGHHFKQDVPKAFAIPYVFLFIFIIIFFIVTLLKAATIQIDAALKTITFKHVFLRNIEVYSFTDFDNFLDINESSRAGTYKTIYLLKNRLAKKVIKGFYYANIEEIQAALSPIEYLGFQKDSRKIPWRALFKKPLID